jgi:hypothetical protein
MSRHDGVRHPAFLQLEALHKAPAGAIAGREIR